MTKLAKTFVAAVAVAASTVAALVGSSCVGAGGTGTPLAVSLSIQCAACSSSMSASCIA